jgi:hypothetical protein
LTRSNNSREPAESGAINASHDQFDLIDWLVDLIETLGVRACGILDECAAFEPSTHHLGQQGLEIVSLCDFV